MSEGLEKEPIKKGWVDTSQFTDEQIALLAFASQLSSSDIVIDLGRGKKDVIERLARLHGLDTSCDLPKLISQAMALLTQVERSAGIEFEGW